MPPSFVPSPVGADESPRGALQRVSSKVESAEPSKRDESSRKAEDDEDEIPSEKQALFSIRSAIIAAEKGVRARHEWLRHQDAIAAAIFFGSVLTMIACGILYVRQVLPWFVVVPVSAFAASLCHELEHDLIHDLYFRSSSSSRLIQKAMMLFIFFLKCAPLDPFTRRTYHLKHHRSSGTAEDIEERLIGLGQPLLLRIAVALHPGVAALFLRGIKRDNPSFHRYFRFPLQAFEYLHIFSQPLLILVSLGFVSAAPAWLRELATTLLVVWMLPNTLRHACLVLMSTSIHFFGDVERGSILQQTQVLDSPLFLPFQLFCFFFGSEHGIHHIHVSQPFYLRHAVRKEAWKAMREHGQGQVRFNDFGAFLLRDNRWGSDDNNKTPRGH